MKLTLNLLLISIIGLLLNSTWTNAKAINHEGVVKDAKNDTKVNSSSVTTLIMADKQDGDQKPIPTVLKHVVRRREMAPDMPFSLHVNHLPCDLDSFLRTKLLRYFPNHCIWIYNNRYTHEGFYRVYKIYQLEAFLFGQYYERLKRYEIDPHAFDYSSEVKS
ncbi:uncharacterized protein [Drosophila tropicalis]|uniref:uncharacterized protein n=1 Tax=Drosophila tropicalis TaxID=46794 RepID=UPI0035ABD734